MEYSYLIVKDDRIDFAHHIGPGTFSIPEAQRLRLGHTS